MPSCDTPVIFDISRWESPRTENRTIITVITDGILIGTVFTLDWDGICIQWQLIAECYHHKWDTLLGSNCGNQHSQEKCWPGLDWGDRQPCNFVGRPQEVFYIFSVRFNWYRHKFSPAVGQHDSIGGDLIWFDFYQPWCNTIALVEISTSREATR